MQAHESKTQTPYLLIDTQAIKECYGRLIKAFPDATVYYAVKCNPEEGVLKELKQCGAGFEIASAGELDRLVRIGVPPHQIIYNNPVKPAEHILRAFEYGVRDFAFDSPEEVQKLAINAPGSRVHLRLSVSNKGSKINLSSKFGAPRKDALDLLLLARQNNLIPQGVSFHVGSQSERVDDWAKALKYVSKLYYQAVEQNLELTVLNIGGGFPVPYQGRNVPDVSLISQTVYSAIQKLPKNITLWCEPGRFLVGESGIIAASVIGKTVRRKQTWLFLDIGRFQAFVEMFESEDIRYPVSTPAGHKTRTELYTLTGPSCDAYDTIMHEVRLPAGLDVGDVLYFGSTGSYTLVYGAPFNDFDIPKVIYANTKKETK